MIYSARAFYASVWSRQAGVDVIRIMVSNVEWVPSVLHLADRRIQTIGVLGVTCISNRQRRATHGTNRADRSPAVLTWLLTGGTVVQLCWWKHNRSCPLNADAEKTSRVCRTNSRPHTKRRASSPSSGPSVASERRALRVRLRRRPSSSIMYFAGKFDGNLSIASIVVVN